MFGILSYEQLEEYKKTRGINEFLFLGNNISDFAFEILKLIKNPQDVENEYICNPQTVNYGTSNAYYSNSYYPYFKKFGFFTTDSCVGFKLRLKHLPFVPYISLDILPDRIKLKKESRFELIKFGLYPQSLVTDVYRETIIEDRLSFVYNGDVDEYGYTPRAKLSFIKEECYTHKKLNLICFNDNYYKNNQFHNIF